VRPEEQILSEDQKLFLEEVLEGLPGVAVTGRRGVAVHGRLLRVGGGSRILLHRHTKFVKGAVVAGVLRRDPLRDGLGALELRAAVEEPALLAAVQLEVAFGAGAVGIETVGEDGAAIGAARARYGADHARRTRTELIRPGPTLRRPAVVRPFLLFILFRVAVAAMTILAIHKRLQATQRVKKMTSGVETFVAIREPSLLRLAAIHARRLTAVKPRLEKTIATMRKLTLQVLAARYSHKISSAAARCYLQISGLRA
jgi:hypothetical protein